MPGSNVEDEGEEDEDEEEDDEEEEEEDVPYEYNHSNSAIKYVAYVSTAFSPSLFRFVV